MTTMQPWRIERWSKASGEITAKLRKNSGNQKKKKQNLQKTKKKDKERFAFDFKRDDIITKCCYVTDQFKI